MLLQSITIKESLTNIGTSLVEVVPGLIKAVVLLIIGYFIAKYAAFFVKKLLISVNADKIVDKLKEIELFANMDVKLSVILSKVVFWCIFFIFIIISADVLNLDSISQGISKILGFLPNLVSALFIFFAGVFIANLIRGAINTTTASMNIPVGKLIGSIVFYFMVIMISITAAEQAGVETSMIKENINNIVLIFLAALGLGYGISSKDLMSNTLASIYTKNKFRVGQEIKYKHIQGTIVELDSNSAILKNDTGAKFVIPLAKFLQEDIEIVTDFEEEFVDEEVA